MKKSYLKILILILLNLLFIGGIYLAYQKIEEARAIKNYNQQFSKAIQEEEAVEKDKDTILQKGMVGQSYVAAYYPKNNEEPIAVVKEKRRRISKQKSYCSIIPNAQRTHLSGFTLIR